MRLRWKWNTCNDFWWIWLVTVGLSASVTSLEIIPLGAWIGICSHFCGTFEWCLHAYWFWLVWVILMIWWRLVSLLLKSGASVIGRPVCFERLMLLQLKSKFSMQWLLACWLSENGVMNFPDFIRWIWHICGLECYCSEINVTWLCTVLDWFFSRSVCNHEFNIEWSSLYPEIVLGCVACVELVLWIHPVRKLYSIPISLQCLISHIYSLCNVRWALQKPSNGLI